MFSIHRDCRLLCSGFNTLALAEQTAEQLLTSLPDNVAATYAVHNAAGTLLAVRSDRKIEGTILCQAWGGRKGNDAILVREETFDATSHLLLMSLAKLHGLHDGDESTDDVGRHHVAWEGPCEVSIVDSLADYFGVDLLEDITAEALESVRAWAKPEPRRTSRLALSVNVELSHPGLMPLDVLRHLHVNVISDLPDLIVSKAVLL